MSVGELFAIGVADARAGVAAAGAATAIVA
jgi:hypothetical protein